MLGGVNCRNDTNSRVDAQQSRAMPVRGTDVWRPFAKTAAITRPWVETSRLSVPLTHCVWFLNVIRVITRLVMRIHAVDHGINVVFPELNSSRYETTSMPADIDQLRGLPVAEKLRIVEQLWDDIGANSGQDAIQDWHKVEAHRRSVELLANPDIALTREELWKRVEETDG